jgi:tripartite-type tricarboxylate transporter receptor subunit TctC
MQPNRLQRRGLLALAAAATLAGYGTAFAQSWPSKPVTIVVPFPAGGGTDTFARPLYAAMSRNTGKQFLIDNRGGAGGTVGAALASRAAPDGYTFFMGAVHHAIAPSIYPKLSYDIESDFVPIGLIASVPQVIVVNPKRLPMPDLKSLIDYLRKNPGLVNYGSGGNGTSHHLAGELFKLQTGTFITHVPYRGAGPALQDLIGGQVDMMFDGLSSSSMHINSGLVKAVAVAAPQRAPGFPNTPTAAEGGLPSYQVATWYGLWAPKGTPKEIVEAMQAELKKALGSDDLKTIWSGMGAAPPNLWGVDFGRFVNAEVKRWGDVSKKSGAKLD